jgi:ADP-heptose:LPS heptosyltransferase
MLPQVELLARSDGREYSLHAELRLELLADAVVAAFADRGPHPVTRFPRAAPQIASAPYVILAVGAGDPIRRWPQAQFVELGRRLIDLYDFNVVVVGGAAERALVGEIAAGLPLRRVTAHVDLPLPELSGKVARASLLVGLGSGIAHLAATSGVPTISLLSGVSPLDVWRPIGPRVVNLTGQTACSPCGLKRVEDCPFGVTCLYSITPARVLEAAAELLRPAPALSLVRREPFSPPRANAAAD